MGIRDTLFTLMTLVIMVYNSVIIVTGFADVTRQESYRKCYITSFALAKRNLGLRVGLGAISWQRGVLYSVDSIFPFFFVQHRFGSLLNRCEIAKKVTKIDFSNFWVC